MQKIMKLDTCQNNRYVADATPLTSTIGQLLCLKPEHHNFKIPDT